MELIKKIRFIYATLSNKSKIKVIHNIYILIIVCIFEVITLGSALPYLAILNDPSWITKYKFISHYINLYDIDSGSLVGFITIAFVAVVIFSGLLRLYYVNNVTKLGFYVGSEISRKIYENILNQPYIYHININSSSIVHSMTSSIDKVIHHVILPVFSLIGSIVIILCITIFLLILNYKVALISILSITFIYISISIYSKRLLVENSAINVTEGKKIVKTIQEGLGSIRDTIIAGKQYIYSDIYKKADIALRASQASNHFVSQAPRYLIEPFSIAIISIVAYILSRTVENNELLPLLGVFALGSQRLIPTAQNAYSAWAFIRGSSNELTSTCELLLYKTEVENKNSEIVDFNKNITLVDVSYAYNIEDKNILKDVNISINVGDRIGIVGATGSGKSTLIDLLLGLLEPKMGAIVVDGIPLSKKNISSWQKNIAHVPQNIYMSDSSIANNIAFGVKNNLIDMERVIGSAKIAQINDDIVNMPNKYSTVIGERGVKLSGGQRQRIGLARAIYSSAKLLVLDEATSALDDVTESKVMNSIMENMSNMTIIMIAHRVSTLDNCNYIYRVENSTVRLIQSI